ncbi:MAG: NUDIX domain-containing protein [Oscillospiraceae bacterium]|nr:NUDIX domain-containing protein [Oscillospiraceae bacterium]
MEQTEAPEGQRAHPPLCSPSLRLLGKFVRVRVTHALGSPCGEGTYGANFGELAGPALPEAERPDGVFILGPRHPVRLFEGRVAALLFCGDGRRYAVAAPGNSRYIVGQIRRALRFALDPGSYRIHCLYERSCGAVVFHRAEGELRFLLIRNRRSANWGFPKGHVENYETAEQTARREVREETGLRVRLLPGFSCQSEYVISGVIEKSVTIFLAEADDRHVTAQEAEIEDYLWADYHKAMRMLKFENDRSTLRRAYGFLRKWRQGFTPPPASGGAPRKPPAPGSQGRSPS